MSASRGDLRGARIALTRSAEGNVEWRPGLETTGARVVDWPCIVTRALPEASSALATAVAAADRVVFSSARAARALVELGFDAARLDAKRVACVGDRTTAALRALGVEVELVAPEGDARSLAEALVDATAAGERCLLLGAREGRVELAERLRSAGRDVHELALYETRAGSPRAGEDLPELDAIFFASPSAARGFAQHWTPLPTCLCIVIGPTTRAALDELGFAVHGEATERNLEGMLDAYRRAASEAAARN